jgi:hypothetical protein
MAHVDTVDTRLVSSSIGLGKKGGLASVSVPAGKPVRGESSYRGSEVNEHTPAMLRDDESLTLKLT